MTLLAHSDLPRIRCSYCGIESCRPLKWIRSHRRVQCAGCGEEFSLNNNIRKAFDRFRRKLTNMVGRM
jgi:DNA-directed RNA polymerase subunit RPC12/RpoP